MVGRARAHARILGVRTRAALLAVIAAQLGLVVCRGGVQVGSWVGGRAWEDGGGGCAAALGRAV